MGFLRKHGLVGVLAALLGFQTGTVDFGSLGRTAVEIIDVIRDKNSSTPPTFPSTETLPPITVELPTQVQLKEVPEWAVRLEAKFDQQCGTVYNYVINK